MSTTDLTDLIDIVPALARRVRGDVSQRDWADRVGVGRDVISRAETGTRLNRPYLLKLCLMEGEAAAALKEIIQDVPDGRSHARRVTIAEIAAKVAHRRGMSQVTRADTQILDEIASKAGIVCDNSPERWDRVLRGMKRSPKIWKAGYVPAKNSRGYPTQIRSFRLNHE